MVELTNKPLSANQCPLCQQSNCCQEAGVDKKSPAKPYEVKCWCMNKDITFSESLLSKVPLSQRDKACICKQCVIKHQLNVNT